MYGREIDGRAVEFGTTGYTMNNIFVLYDRASGSLWYPTSETSLEATSGPLKGRKIEFLNIGARVPLEQWLADHPDSLIMLPPRQEDVFKVEE